MKPDEWKNTDEEKRTLIKKYHTEWRQKNKAKYSESNRRFRQKERLLALIKYSKNPPKCMCCGETELKFLTLDHIDGGGHKHSKVIRNTLPVWLRRNNYPSGYQTLCFNCNCGKSINKGICPHQNITLKKK